jgi:hypothetical protein
MDYEVVNGRIGTGSSLADCRRIVGLFVSILPLLENSAPMQLLQVTDNISNEVGFCNPPLGGGLILLAHTSSPAPWHSKLGHIVHLLPTVS